MVSVSQGHLPNTTIKNEAVHSVLRTPLPLAVVVNPKSKSVVDFAITSSEERGKNVPEPLN
jgi:hypothetical protein